MTDKESSLFHNAKIRDICVFVSTSTLSLASLTRASSPVVWECCWKPWLGTFCIRDCNISSAATTWSWHEGPLAAKLWLNKIAWEAFTSVYLSFCLNKLSEKASLDHGWSILGKGKLYIPVMVSLLHCKTSVWRKRNLLPSTGDSVCWSNYFLPVQYLQWLCHRAN